MGQLKVETPDGQSFVIDYPDGATDEQINGAVRQHLGGKFSSNPIKRNNPIVQGQEVLGSKPGYQDLIMQGVSFGLSDEAGGALNMLMHPLTNGAYEQGRDAIRQRVDQAREETGWAGTAAELAGGLLGGLPKAGAGALLTIGNAVKRGASIGALGGAVGGFGSGNGAVDSLIKAGVGGVAGAALGTAIPVGANLISNRVSGVGRLVGRDTDGLARQIVGETLQADNATPAQLGRRLIDASERGTPLALADTGENVRGLLASVSRRPGPARPLARDMVEARQAEQSGRVLSAIDSNLGPIRGVRQQSDELMQQARTAAAPLYDEFRAGAGRTSPELEAILDTPAGRQALGKARTIAANERRDPNAMGFDLNEQGEVTLNSVPSPETLDYVKRGLDDILEDARDPVTRQINYTPSLRAIEDVRKSLVREADNLHPAYAEARAAFAGPASAEEALQLGRKSLTASAEDIEAATSRMGDAEREQFALGFRAAMADNIGRATDGASQTQRLLGTRRKRQALASVFGGEEDFNRFLATMADERATNETYRSVMTGSQTAERQLADQQTSDGGLIESATGTALRGVSEPIGLLGDALKSLGEVSRFGAGEAGDRTRESIAALLTETDPNVLEGLAKAIKDATTRQRLRTRNINRATGKLGAGVGGFTGNQIGSNVRSE